MLKKTLDNGLEVFIYEDHRSPIFSFVLLYKVGSMDESPGKTGVSHLVEHMIFKGSENVDGTKLNYHVRRHGGYLNATTSEDKTCYFMTMPVSQREYPIRIWGDLMANATMKPDEFQSERDVVVEERILNSEDDPIGALFETLSATAFWAHPYRWPVIGWMSDIQSISHSDLYEYYKRFYSPDNAIIVGSGDIDSSEILSLIEKHFGCHSKNGTPIVRTITQEPHQTGLRRSTIHKTAELPVVMMGFHSPNITDDRVYPLLIAEKIISSGESSRIYRNIIHEKRLATMAGGFYDYLKRDPGLFIFYAQASPDKSIATLEAALWSEVERMREGDFDSKEIQKAKNILEARFIYRREQNLMESLKRGEFHLVSSMGKYDEFVDKIRDVTHDEIKDVCSKIFSRNNATVVDLVPVSSSGGSGNTVHNAKNWKPGTFYYKPHFHSASQQDLPDGLPFWRDADKFELTNGIRVVAYHRDNLPIVQVGILVQAGAFFDPLSKAGLATLTGNMIKAGTESRNGMEIADEIERIGSSFDLSVGRQTLSLGMKCLSRFLKTGLDILSESLIYPTFLDDEVIRYKEMQCGDIKSFEDDVWPLAAREFVRNLYKDSSYGSPISGDLETVDAIKRDDIVEFHKKYYTGKNTIITIVGDFERESLKKDLEFYFSKMPTGEYTEAPEFKNTNFDGIVMEKYQKDLSLSTIALGGFLFPRNHEDYFPYLLLNLIFGGDPLASRLGETIREKHGLTYNIQSGFNPMKKTGYWNVMLQTKNDSTQKAIDLIRGEIKKLRENEITDDELSDARSNFRGRSALEVESNRGLAMKLISVEYNDLGDFWLENFFKSIDAVTKEQIQKMARKYLDPERFLLMIVGDGGEMSVGF